MEKGWLSNKWSVELHYGQKIPFIVLIPYTKVNSRWNENINVEDKIDLLQKKTYDNIFYNFGEAGFLKLDTKTLRNPPPNIWYNLIKE